MARATASILTLSLVFACGACGSSSRGTAGPDVERCVPGTVPAGRPPWETGPYRLCIAHPTPSGDTIYLEMPDTLSRISPRGEVLWRVAFQEGHNCGQPTGMAVGYDDSVAITCGFSVLRLTGQGRFSWQVWPAGGRAVSPPLIDREGNIYVGGAGRLYALRPDGSVRWALETGRNRFIENLTIDHNGRLMFLGVTGDRPTSQRVGDTRFFDRYEPPELVVVSRQGRVIQRSSAPEDFSSWPPYVDLRRHGGRIP